MKKLIFAMLLVPFLSLSAQTTTPPVSAGLTPDSPFYFLDKLGETISEWLTQNPEAKARLQISFASERIAEIAVMLDAKGIDASGLEVAQSRFEEHLTKASEIVKSEKSKGKDVKKLSEDLKDEFEASKEAFKQSIEDSKNVLEQDKEQAKTELEQAKKDRNTARVEMLNNKINDLEDEKDALEQQKEEQDQSLELDLEEVGKAFNDGSLDLK